MAEAVLRPQELFAALDAAQVDYVTIGGFAVNAHGVPRATFDVDIAVSRSDANLRRLAEALTALDAPETVRDAAGFLELDPRDPFDLARGSVVTVPTRVGTLDIVAQPPGAAPFEDLASRAIDVTVGGTRIRVVGRDDLIAMKRAGGRPKDRSDLADLLRDV